LNKQHNTLLKSSLCVVTHRVGSTAKPNTYYAAERDLCVSARDVLFSVMLSMYINIFVRY